MFPLGVSGSFASSKPSFKVYQSTSQSIAANTRTKVVFQTVVYDTMGNFNNSEFTAPEDGIYFFTALAQAGLADGEVVDAHFYLNGLPYVRVFDAAAGAATGSECGGSAPVKMARGDKVSFVILYGLAEALTVGEPYTFFTGVKVL